MPTYEYRCNKGHDFEVMQRMADDPVAECEVCGAPVQRVFSPVAVHFKGTGFYSTDYGSKNRARELKESAEAKKKSSDTASSDSSSSDSSGSDSSGSDSKKPTSTSAKTKTKASAAES
ncbi:MAG TPA: zinc ribbon domain-containing protein [Solirubrobacteraceae bacterium]|jgi:putative FmdB family regulatory protein|nr:zinc ribbon domain-containing protein [Solirubrobacteraceae bacterium]